MKWKKWLVEHYYAKVGKSCNKNVQLEQLECDFVKEKRLFRVKISCDLVFPDHVSEELRSGLGRFTADFQGGVANGCLPNNICFNSTSINIQLNRATKLM